MTILGLPWQDLALSTGGVVGTVTTLVALFDKETEWRRSNSLVKATMFIPSLLAYYSLGLYITLSLSVVSMLSWFGICLLRAPEESNG